MPDEMVVAKDAMEENNDDEDNERLDASDDAS